MSQLSLAELDALSDTNKTPDPPPIKDGDGTPTAADLETARLAQLDKEGKGPDGKPKPIVDQTAATKAAADKAAADKVIADKAEADRLAAEGDDNDDDSPAGTVWDDVDALRGEKLNVDWGDIPEADRDTPRGILAREKAIEKQAVTRFEQSIMETDPRGYQYLLHRQAGGTDEEFFAQPTITLPEYERFKESVDLQTKVYKDALRNAGIPEKQVTMLVDNAVKDKELFTLADAAYKKQQQTEQQDIRALNDQLARSQQQYERNVTALGKTIDEQIASTDMGVIVPEAKRVEFTNYVRQRIKYDEQTGMFLFAQPIDPKLLPRQLEGMYMQFVNGNLKDVIQRDAQTQNTRRLRRTIDASKTPMRGQPDTSKKKMTLGEI